MEPTAWHFDEGQETDKQKPGFHRALNLVGAARVPTYLLLHKIVETTGVSTYCSSPRRGRSHCGLEISSRTTNDIIHILTVDNFLLKKYRRQFV